MKLRKLELGCFAVVVMTLFLLRAALNARGGRY